jgi:pimeloyl-ACP methyl ester carboxylesterase
LTQREIRRDLRKYLRAARKDDMLAAAERLRSFDRPALVLWAADDRVMPPEHGRRLAELLPQGRLIEIPDSYTLIPEDQPGELARAVRQFIGDTQIIAPRHHGSRMLVAPGALPRADAPGRHAPIRPRSRS